MEENQHINSKSERGEVPGALSVAPCGLHHQGALVWTLKFKVFI